MILQKLIIPLCMKGPCLRKAWSRGGTRTVIHWSSCVSKTWISRGSTSVRQWINGSNSIAPSAFSWNSIIKLIAHLSSPNTSSLDCFRAWWTSTRWKWLWPKYQKSLSTRLRRRPRCSDLTSRRQTRAWRWGPVVTSGMILGRTKMAMTMSTGHCASFHRLISSGWVLITGRRRQRSCLRLRGGWFWSCSRKIYRIFRRLVRSEMS